ncbi:NTP transferase domain-containing protein [Planktomarina sp.]|nr:NTP transferase domain-containing protein [Planktomarina sp.]
MQIVIPMSGFGERFRAAGYDRPKPLIEVEGKPIIAHVIDMFPGEDDFTFICNQDHLDDKKFKMREIITQFCPQGKIIGIPPHKLGPIHAIQQIIATLRITEPVVVNYCDFTCYWDWENFKDFVANSACDGAIPAYRGFHPHTLGSTNYAYLREVNGRISDIQEKQPFTQNRMEEYASSGTYYFSSVQLMSDAFSDVVVNDLSVAGEFYVSLAYRPMLKSNGLILVYPIQHFMQWGTPDDVIEYNAWSSTFNSLISNQSNEVVLDGTVIIPMAGIGQRFVNEGYDTPKPLIPVSGLPMVVQAALDLPTSKMQVFVLRKDMEGCAQISKKLKEIYPTCVIKTLTGITNGQASTALEAFSALDELKKSAMGPITIGACDNGVLYDHGKLMVLLENTDIDVIVWTIRGYANAIRQPSMYGWVDCNEDGLIRNISVKKPLNTPKTDPIVMGTFIFRKTKDYHDAFESLVQRDGTINGEFYIDSLINDAISLGLKCHIFEVDSYLCWGTPNDLKTFEYWQSCFHKWETHPYRLDLDRRIPKDMVQKLSEQYKPSVIERPNKDV